MGDGNADRPHPSKDFIEEYFFENAQLGFLEARNYLRRPHQVPKPAKLQTVSIIDTLSELARDGQLESDTMHENPEFLSSKDTTHLKVRGIRSGSKSSESVGSSRRHDRRLPKKDGAVDLASFDDVGMSAIYTRKPTPDKIVSYLSHHNSGHRTNNPTASVSRHSRMDRVDASSSMRYPIKCAAVRTSTSSKMPNIRVGTVKSVKSKKSRLQSQYVEKANRSVIEDQRSHKSSSEISRYCFSDSEIDILSFSSNRLGSRSIESGKHPSVGCLAVAERSAGKIGNSFKSSDFSVHKPPASSSELSLPMQAIDQFHDEFIEKPIRKSDLPAWIRTLFVTAKQGNVEMLKMAMIDMDRALVRNLSDRSGNNLWHLCAAYNQLACIKWLCKSYGDDVLKDENKNGQTPVVLAVKFGSLSVVQWFYEHCFNRCITDKFDGNRSLLHYAAKYGQGPVMTWLLNVMDKGTNVNFVDSYGNTPLHLAAKYGHIQCVKELFLQHGSLMIKNDAGLKAYDLALCSNQTACAEYILSLETSYILSKEHSILKSDINRYKAESTEAKNVIQELLLLLKDSLTHQKQLIDFVHNIQLFQPHEDEVTNLAVTTEKESESLNEGTLGPELKHFSCVVLKGDETAFNNISDKWKRICRRTNLQMTISKHETLDIIRSQFSKIQSKANYYGAMQEAGVGSLSESSLSDASGDETYSISKRYNLSYKPRNSRQPWLSKKRRQISSPKLDPVPFINDVKLRNVELKGIDRRPVNLLDIMDKEHSPRALGLITHSQLPLSDIDLKELFERNPELKQEGRTCSVIEVLEPSSSENEELSHLNLEPNPNRSNCEVKQSIEAPRMKIISQAPGSNLNKDANPKGDVCQNFLALRSQLHHELAFQPALSIEDKTKKSTSPSLSKSGDSAKSSKCGPKVCDSNTPSIETEADLPNNNRPSSVPSSSLANLDLVPSRKESFQCNDVLTPESLSVTLEPGTSNEGRQEFSDPKKGSTPSVKKKGFLLKFSLKNRWSSKQKPQNSKKSSESSSEDSKDTSKGSLDSWEASSSPECDLFFQEAEDASAETVSCRDPLDISNETFKAEPLARKLVFPERLLPPPPSITRRDPPPEPPLDNAELDFHTNTVMENSSVCLSDIYNSCSLLSEGASSSRNTTEDLNSNEQFCTASELSRLYSSMGKIDSRPPSSASRIDSSIRIDETYKGVGYPLSKMSSTSTELQVSPGSSTAGRHSPAPSEVSKTESALSPPSDVSKTESQCHMKHLSRIEEILKVQNGHDTGCLGNTLLNMASLAHQPVPCEVVSSLNATAEFESLPKSEAVSEFRPIAVTTKKRTSNKPWYDVSDEEDILSPDRYHTLKDQSSNSEDETGDMLS